MPDYTLAPTEQGIREAHLYAQIPSLLSIAPATAHPLSVLRNDSPEPITVTPWEGAIRTPWGINPTPVTVDRTPVILMSGETATLPTDTYVIVCTTNGRFTITRT